MGLDDKLDQLKGQAKEAAGDLTDNEKLENEGKADQLIGNAKEKLSEAGDAIKDKANEVAAKVEDKADEARDEADR
ncbi:CsbD family protein [Corynebacterium coyleae]|uniref:CsbD family protein n=1 Tax=Corynebacterium coyleae TaxID=53374 RepID=UPI001CCBCDD5|nr:CsbD family protein [Corynebacterium coyleae]UBI09126.1 CsbD family protein [Corynebacterium coyleae]